MVIFFKNYFYHQVYACEREYATANASTENNTTASLVPQHVSNGPDRSSRKHRNERDEQRRRNNDRKPVDIAVQGAVDFVVARVHDELQVEDHETRDAQSKADVLGAELQPACTYVRSRPYTEQTVEHRVRQRHRRVRHKHRYKCARKL
ncbi:hypothetical protein AYI70_g9704 [Smittium culicis]|uniref:Uncharacterized protein n=1 Tax=Smittium culicis TaxID=133412 RepID=A0A1R1XA11_9FUNG|nr:hypothetical protein AYI70_g9704 [Smittium culicis]